MLYRHCYVHRWANKTRITCIRNRRSKPIHSLIFLSLCWLLKLCSLWYIMLRWTEIQAMPQIHFCRIFRSNKSTQPLSVPSTSLLQLIATIIKHICFLIFHDINQNILVIVSVTSYKNPFSTDRRYCLTLKVPVIIKISNWNVLFLHYTKYLLCLDLTLWPPALYPLVQGALYVSFLVVMVYHCKVSMTFVLKWRHTMPSMCGNLLVLDEPCSRGLVHNWLSIVFLTVTIVISHTKVSETVDHKWTPCGGSSSRNGLKQDKLVTIPLVNERIEVVFTSRILVGKSEERVSVDVERLHISRSVSLKRVQFNKVTSWPFEHSGLNRKLVLGVVTICKSDECVTVNHKRCASGGTVSWYALKSVKLAAAPFVDNWLCRVGTSVMVVGYCEIPFPKYLEIGEASCSVCWQFLKVYKQRSIPLIDCRVQPVCSIVMISDSKEMFVSDRKVLQVIRSSCLQGLVQRQSSSWVVHLVDHGTCLVVFNVPILVRKSKKQVSINGEMFHTYSSSSW